MECWNNSDVINWISSFPCMIKYKEYFSHHEIDGLDLLQLNEEHLKKELSIHKLHDRLMFLRKLNNLKLESQDSDPLVRVQYRNMHLVLNISDARIKDVLNESTKVFKLSISTCILIDKNGVILNENATLQRLDNTGSKYKIIGLINTADPDFSYGYINAVSTQINRIFNSVSSINNDELNGNEEETQNHRLVSTISFNSNLYSTKKEFSFNDQNKLDSSVKERLSMNSQLMDVASLIDDVGNENNLESLDICYRITRDKILRKNLKYAEAPKNREVTSSQIDVAYIPNQKHKRRNKNYSKLSSQVGKSEKAEQGVISIGSNEQTINRDKRRKRVAYNKVPHSGRFSRSNITPIFRPFITRIKGRDLNLTFNSISDCRSKHTQKMSNNISDEFSKRRGCFFDKLNNYYNEAKKIKTSRKLDESVVLSIDGTLNLNKKTSTFIMPDDNANTDSRLKTYIQETRKYKNNHKNNLRHIIHRKINSSSNDDIIDLS